MTRKQAVVGTLCVAVWLASIWLAFAAGLMFQVSSDLHYTKMAEETQLRDWKHFLGQLESGKVDEATEVLKGRISSWTQLVELKRQLPRLTLWDIALSGFSPTTIIVLLQVESAPEVPERNLAKDVGRLQTRQ